MPCGGFVIALICICSAGGAWRYGPGLLAHWREEYWRRQCMNYSPSEDLIVFDDPGGTSSELLDLTHAGASASQFKPSLQLLA